uniref:hypothetical protein n=1 Tax=Stomatohabitans albus TaxID=3110766 RepID=UPI00300C4C2F
AVDGIWGNDTTRGLTHAHARAQQVCRRDYGPHWSPAQVDLMDAALLSEAVSRLGDLEAEKAA